MKHRISGLTLAVMGAVLLVACAEYDYFDRVLNRSTQNAPVDTVVEEADIPAGAVDTSLDYFSVTGTWSQPDNVGAIAKPEVVFVVDTSGSMGNEVQAIKDSIIGWINQLNSQNVFDFCLGVMRAHTNNNTSGKLVSASGNSKCICTYGDGAVSPDVAGAEFRENLDAALGASGGSTVEAGIYSANRALNDADILAENQAAGCFRDDATLVYGLVSDENDSGYSSNGGGIEFNNDFFLGEGNEFSNTRGDQFYRGQFIGEQNVRRDFYADLPADLEQDFVDEYYGGDVSGLDPNVYVNYLTHETLIADMQAYNGDLPTFGFAIGYRPDNLPPSGQGDPFWGGMSYADDFGLDIVDLRDSVAGDDAAFQASMNEMADALALQISFYDSFSLGETICDVDGDSDFTDETVTVRVNGTTVNASNYDINNAGNKILFNQNFDWVAGAEINISYIRCE